MIDGALRSVDALLPGSWSIEVVARQAAVGPDASRRADAVSALIGPEGTEVRFLVECRRSGSPTRLLLARLRELVTASALPLLYVSDYIGPALRASLATERISYADLVADPDVDAVYVASPHSHHRDQAVLAARAGKHVLVEKALARNLTEVEDIFTAAHQAGVFAMEAMWTRHLPHIVELHRLLDTHVIGDLVTVIADHGQYMEFDPKSRLYDPGLAGGALLDLGVYPIAFALDFLGLPDRVSAAGQLTRTGVDGQVAAVLGYDKGQQGVAHTTLWARTATTAVVSGTDGRIEVEDTFYAPTRFRFVPREGEATEFDGRVDNGFQFQIAEMARCVAEGRRESERMSHQHSRDLMAVMDEVRRQIGVSFPGETARG